MLCSQMLQCARFRLASLAIATCHGMQVYDMRQAARVLHSIPFNAGPALLRWHPLSKALLLAVGPGSSFLITNAQDGLPQEGSQVCFEGVHPRMPGAKVVIRVCALA